MHWTVVSLDTAWASDSRKPCETKEKYKKNQNKH